MQHQTFKTIGSDKTRERRNKLQASKRIYCHCSSTGRDYTSVIQRERENSPTKRTRQSILNQWGGGKTGKGTYDIPTNSFVKQRLAVSLCALEWPDVDGQPRP